MSNFPEFPLGQSVPKIQCQNDTNISYGSFHTVACRDLTERGCFLSSTT